MWGCGCEFDALYKRILELKEYYNVGIVNGVIEPIVAAKGVDEGGKEFERIIYINKVNPSWATVVEMRGLF